MNSETRRIAVRKVSDYLDAMLEAPSAFRGIQLRGSGPVSEFEAILAERCGFQHCLATASATAGLISIAAAAGLKTKTVIVPTGIWAGTPGALKLIGARVIEADLGMDGTIDPEVAASIAGSETCAAIVAADHGERRHDAEAIRSICDKANCLYIEDTSWLPGISAPLGSRSLADIQVMSFGPGKPLSLGEGGAVLFKDAELYRRAVSVSQHPERCVNENIDYSLDDLALNARIHPVAALLGSAALTEGFMTIA